MTEDEIVVAAEHSDRIADELERLADAAEKLNQSRLTQRTLLVLLKDQTGIPMADIKAVLKALPELRNLVKKPPAKGNVAE